MKQYLTNLKCLEIDLLNRSDTGTDICFGLISWLKLNVKII